MPIIFLDHLLGSLAIRKVNVPISKSALISLIFDDSLDTLIGSVFNDQYKIKKFLGKGTFGKAYYVEDQKDLTS